MTASNVPVADDWPALFDWIESPRGTEFLSNVRVGKFSFVDVAAIAWGCGVQSRAGVLLLWKVCFESIEELDWCYHPVQKIEELYFKTS